MPEPDADGVSSTPMGEPVDADTRDLLRELLLLPPQTARQIHDGVPRRRGSRPQEGPGADLG